MKMSTITFCLCFFSFFNLSFAKELKGEKISIGNGVAYSYVTINAKKVPVSFGVALTREALDNLPDADTSFHLKFPRGISFPPYEEIMIDWNAKGHEPAGIYDIPHFDFHFYAIDDQQRQSIKCTGDDLPICMKMPSADFLAEFYIPTPAGVPMMGWHWLDSRSPELHGQRFTSTFIYGYYDAELIFLEPMITREFLLNYGCVDQILPMPKKFTINGYYPKRYSMQFDPKKNIYRIELSELFFSDTNK